MAKILNGRLPLANQNMVDSVSFNRAMRILELNLGAFDPTATPQYTSAVSYTHLTLPTKA